MNIQEFLCRFGLHDWRYGKRKAVFTPGDRLLRACIKCGHAQFGYSIAGPYYTPAWEPSNLEARLLWP